MIHNDIYDGPPAGYTNSRTRKRYVAIHNTSNTATAASEASYAKRRTDQVSSHYYVDRTQIIQSLDTALCAWHAASDTGNTYAIAYEITGTNDRSRQWWLDNVAWSLLAKQVAADCREFGITPQLLNTKQMNDGHTTGMVTHLLMTQAWGGDHTDPGPNFPMDHLLALVSAELEGGSVPTEEQWNSLVKDVKAIRERQLGDVEQRDEVVTSWAADSKAKEQQLNVQREKRIEGKLDQVLAGGAGGLPGLSAEQVRAIVREELDKTKLAGA